VPPAELPSAAGPLVDTSNIKAIGGAQSHNTLIIGTDSRADVSAEEAKTFGKGEVSGKRSDTIMILRTDPETGQAAILSFPRDLYVHISGTTKNDRINSAYAKSASTLVQTIKDNFGIPITHVVEVDFTGFETVVGTLGGVEIDFPKASRDTVTGLNQPAGRNLLTPQQAVAYVRSRHFETGEAGKWTPDGRGDLGRVVRQQAFIKAVIQRAIDQGARNPLTANALLANATGAIKLDPTFSLGKLGELASNFRAFDPASLLSYTVPGVPVRIDKKAVLRVDKSKAAKVVGRFGRRTT
jgi:polyisoprenyl-teichoic acid--peptidoglycan teichoic acid transferase